VPTLDFVPVVPSLRVPSVLVLLALAGLALSLVLARHAGGGASLPGCGPDGGCEAVAKSRWARAGPLPVVWLGAAAYAAATIAAVAAHPWVAGRLPEAVRSAAAAGLLTLGLTAAGTGLWFVLLQTAVIRQFCGFCTATHAAGLLLAGLAIATAPATAPVVGCASAAAALVGLLVVVQCLVRPATYAVTASPPTGGTSTADEAGLADAPAQAALAVPAPESPGLATPEVTAVDAADDADRPSAIAPKPATGSPPPLPPPPKAGRRVALAGGNVLLSLGDWPLLGRTDAPAVLALLFDHTCKACRQMHRTVAEAVERSGGRVAVLCVPVPQSSRCNPLVPPNTRAADRRGDDSPCQYARLTAALFDADPAAWGAFQGWFDASVAATGQAPPFAAALERVRQLVPAVIWPPGPRAEARVGAAVEVFRAARLKQVPAVLLPRAAVTGLVPSADRLLELVGQETGRPAVAPVRFPSPGGVRHSRPSGSSPDVIAGPATGGAVGGSGGVFNAGRRIGS
jgi:uncharacterized membrane protein